MIIIGCDFHTRYQQIAMADDKTGEILLERRLDHGSGEATPSTVISREPCSWGSKPSAPFTGHSAMACRTLI